jgi:hypothetical protein
MWPAYDGRSYPFDGNDPLAYASGGFLWGSALRAKRTFADFGEFISSDQYVNGNWSTYRTKLLQQWRQGEQFESTFHVKSPIPPLGQIVEGLSHSKFWPNMAVFVVEDDAQGGIDHVDGHRTVALAISPYIRRGSIDSTMYSHPSISKTIEMMLGLKNLSLFDLIANGMRNSFTDKPDFTPYTAVTPKQSIFEVNPLAQSLSGQARKDAIASARMNWTVPDAAPAKQLLDILWRNAKSYDRPVPKQRSAAFLPYAAPGSDEDGDDERPHRGSRVGEN